MQCPKCAKIVDGNFCSNCGYNFQQAMLTNQDQMPNTIYTSNIPPQIPSYQQSPGMRPQGFPGQPLPKIEWYKDGSLYGLLLLVISPFLLWSISTFFGFAFSILAIIFGVTSKKKGGRISTLTTIFAIIVLVGEVIVVVLLYLAAYMLGVV